MSPTFLSLVLAFSLSLLGTLIFCSHMMATLLCLEGMMLSLFLMISLLTLNSYSPLLFLSLFLYLQPAKLPSDLLFQLWFLFFFFWSFWDSISL